MPIVSGATPATAHEPQLRERLQAELAGAVGVGDDADGATVVLAAGVPRRDGRLGVARGHQRFQPRELLQRAVRARVLVGVDRARPLPGRRLDRHDLLGEDALLLGGDGPAMGAQRELVLLGAGDAVLAAEVLGRFDHPAGHFVVDTAGGDPRSGEPVLERHASRPSPPSACRWRRTRPGSCSRPRRPARRRPRPSGPPCRPASAPTARRRSGGRSGALEPPPAGPRRAPPRARSRAPPRSA